jgi:hypothetical protein
MSAPEDQQREERALDALMVLALRPDLAAGGPAPGAGRSDSGLSEEDRRALDALGSDLAARVAAGAWGPWPARCGRELTGSLHRAEGECDLTEQAREELERKVRELDEEEGDSRP